MRRKPRRALREVCLREPVVGSLVLGGGLGIAGRFGTKIAIIKRLSNAMYF